jgi:endonuclease III
MARTKKPKPTHSAEDFGLDVLSSDDDMFRWFLLVYMLGKPIQSVVAVKTWQIFIDNKLDTPWAIMEASERRLVSLLHTGGYTRYQNVMAHSLHKCMDQLLRGYDGSIMYMLNISQTEEELSKQLQKLHGVGPKTAEIFMRETEEYFARRVE